MSDFASHHAECAIPHVMTSSGVVVSTTCSSSPLRLTHEHLVFTEHGLRTAGSLTQGTVLFSDLAQKVPCKVTSIQQEHAQKYFGLNCLESVVLAEDVLCSTFGVYHHVPAAWMKYAGSVLGAHRAS